MEMRKMRFARSAGSYVLATFCLLLFPVFVRRDGGTRERPASTRQLLNVSM